MLSDKPKPKPKMALSTVHALAGDQSQRADNAPSYENYLRIKQGVGAAALRAAGLPAAEELSYDAYAAALRAAKTGVRGEPPMQALDLEPLAPQALAGPVKSVSRARRTVAWCVGLGVAFIGGMVINEYMQDQHISDGPDLAPVAAAIAEPAPPVAKEPAPLLLLQPTIARVDRLPRPSPVASLPAEMLLVDAGPTAPVASVAKQPFVAATPAAQPVELVPKPKPAAAKAKPPAAPQPAKKPVVRSQNPVPTLWDSLTDLLASNKSSGATAKQRWRNKSEDR